MTGTAIARNKRNARTTREIGNNKRVYPKGALSHKSMGIAFINSGVSKVVIVKGCSNCGYRLQEKKVECQTILTRFKCPQCGNSIENSNENRCKVCFMLCSDSETHNAHKWGGCPNADTLYPFKGHLAYRDENPKERVLV